MILLINLHIKKLILKAKLRKFKGKAHLVVEFEDFQQNIWDLKMQLKNLTLYLKKYFKHILKTLEKKKHNSQIH